MVETIMGQGASFELPFLEDIYDMETEELEHILNRINSDMQRGSGNCVLPVGIESFDKYERKAAKLRDSLELEIEERQQVDNVLNFFTDNSKNFLDDDAFYKLDTTQSSGTAATQPSQGSFDPSKFQQQKQLDGLQGAISAKNLPGQQDFQQDQQLLQMQQMQKIQQNQSVGAHNNQALLNEIDPHRVMDDMQSEYSTSQKSTLPHALAQKPPTLQDDDEEQDGAASSIMHRKPMTKKELQAFMKAKLAKTKVTDSVMTGTAASGPTTKNFTNQNRREGVQRKDLGLVGPNRKPPVGKKAQNPTSTPSTYKGKGDEMADEDSDDDIAAANERMKAAAAKFSVNTNSNSSAPAKKKKVRAPSRGFEEHKSTVRNMSKNIYKPSFNLPAKDPKEKKMMAETKPKSNARDAAKAYAEESRKKQRQSSAQRNSRAKAQATTETNTSLKDKKESIATTANQTGSSVFSKPKLTSSKGSRASTQMLSETQDSTNTSKQSAKPPLKPSSSKAQLPPEAKAEEVEHELESAATVNVGQKKEEQLELDDEEIESRYSDGKDQTEPDQEAATTESQIVTDQARQDEERKQKCQEDDSATTGETGTTDLNSNVVEQPALDQTPIIESTADMIMQRAEQLGDFNQFQDQKDANDQLEEEAVQAKMTSDEAIDLSADPKATGDTHQQEIIVGAELGGEFTLGPQGFKKASQENTDQHEKQNNAEERNQNFEGTVATDDFYSVAGGTREQDDLKNIMVIEQSKGANPDAQIDDDYEEVRARFEEIKKAELDQDDEEQPDEYDQENGQQTSTGGLESAPVEIDIEAMNLAIEETGINKQALDEESKVDLDQRLKQAADEAKAKGKKTGTFDKLRKAVNEKPEVSKKQEAENMQDRSAKMSREIKEKMAKKAQTGTTETPVKPSQSEVNEQRKQDDAQQALTDTKETPAKKTAPSSATKPNGSTVAKKKMLAKAEKNNPFNKNRNVKLDEDLSDYSHIYRNFYDIFVGSFSDLKGFDVNFAVRETRNIYASFVNLMQNDILMSQKHKFDKHPLEIGYKDYYKNQVPNHLGMVGEKLNELELMIQNRDQSSTQSIKQQQKALMMAAMTQAQLREKYKELKNKDQDEINRQAQALTQAPQPADFDGQEQQQTGADASSAVAKQTERPSQLYFRVVKTKSEVYDIITRSFGRKPRWNELPHGMDLRNSWNLMWMWSKLQKDMSRMLVWQRANHFIGAKNVSRKDFLKRNIERAQKFSSKAKQVFEIMPLTFILPKEYVAFLELFSDLEEKEGRMNYWIMKPAAQSRGRGISLVNDISQVHYGEPMVMQRYLKTPLLLNGYKFDLRIYVLVTSVNPIEIFIYKEGFGRFSTQPYTLDPSDKANKYIHLTNVSINKYNLKNYDCNNQDRIYGGTKVSLATLKKTFVEDLKIDWDNIIWTQIKQVCLKAMVAAQNDIAFNPNCFDLYGFDVIFDEDLKCWLLEINASPALSCETLLDDMIKQRLIDDTIDLIDPVDYDRKRLFEVLERRAQEEFGGAKTTGNQHQKRSMNKDLTYILHGKVPRAYGEMPKNLGNYERLAPSDWSESYLKLIGGQKMFGSQMKVSEKMTPAQREKVRGPGSMPVVSDKQGGNQIGATPARASVGGTVSTVTAKKQQQQGISLADISTASNHRMIIKP